MKFTLDIKEYEEPQEEAQEEIPTRFQKMANYVKKAGNAALHLAFGLIALGFLAIGGTFFISIAIALFRDYGYGNK